jgi:hypothetical protein
MDESQVIGMVRNEVTRAGSMRALCREWGVTPSYMCDLLNGRRAPGPKILGPLKLTKRKTVVYGPSR